MTNLPPGLITVRVPSNNGTLTFLQEVDQDQYELKSNNSFEGLLARVNHNYANHRRILKRAAIENASPLFYAAFTSPQGPPVSVNSAENTAIPFRKYYDNIMRQLDSLAKTDGGEPEVEVAAVDTAKNIAYYLRDKQYSPPAISWHGGDAVVMIWALADVTFAVTVTDGEFGYVVRQNKKLIKSADSLAVASFKLLEHG